MLEEQNHRQNKDSQQQVFHGTKVLRSIAAAEGVDANGDQAQADGHHHSTGNHCREELAQGLQEETQDAFKKTADDGCAHNGTIGNYTAAHRCGNGVENTQKTGGSAHNNGNITANGADGEKLNQSDNTCNQHCVLEQMQLQFCELTAGNTAGTGNNQQRRQVADEHGQNVLQAQRNRLRQRHLPVKLEGFFRQRICLFHREPLSILLKYESNCSILMQRSKLPKTEKFHAYFTFLLTICKAHDIIPIF